MGSLTANNNELSTDITNGASGSILITRFFAQWVESIPPAQSLDQLSLQGVSIWDRSDPNSPSDIPSEGAWKIPLSNRVIPVGVRTFTIQFKNALEPGDYQVYLVFGGINCQVNQSVTVTIP
jgi:hypothetical protein